MATPAKRASAPTHPTVWIGLALSAGGLLLALYAYSGIRVYDITYAVVALVGGIVCLAGILLSAWGRAIMAARAGRMRRAAIQTDALKLATEGFARSERNPQRAALEAALEDQPPTVAAPAGKEKLGRTPGKMFAFRQKKEEKKQPPAAAAVFAFRRHGAVPASPAPSAPASEAAVAAPQKEHLEIRCPRCSTVFQAEGVRPFEVACPSCALAGTV